MSGKKNSRAVWVRAMCIALAFLMISSMVFAIIALL